jgi:hypothetical protein
MDHATDIRARIDADAFLQAEINRALLAIADSMSQGSDLRLVRILVRTLEASWAEHVSFQQRVVFPIVAHSCRGVVGVQMAIDRLEEEHGALTAQHAALRECLDRLAGGDLTSAARLQGLVVEALRGRNAHFDADDGIAGRLPPAFGASDLALYSEWMTQRLSPRFPLGLLATGQPYRRGSGSAQ